MLVSVSPLLLAEFLARELRLVDLEVVVVDDPFGFDDERDFTVAVTNGLPPPRARATTVVQLPDRARGSDLGSLVTTSSVERVPIPDLASAVRVVHELCRRAAVEPG